MGVGTAVRKGAGWSVSCPTGQCTLGIAIPKLRCVNLPAFEIFLGAEAGLRHGVARPLIELFRTVLNAPSIFCCRVLSAQATHGRLIIL